MRLEFSYFAKPVQRALDLCAFQSVTAKEFFQTHLLKPGALERVINSFMRARRSDRVRGAAADPDWRIQEIRGRFIIVVGRGHSIGINSSQKQTTDFKPAIARQHWRKNSASLCPA